MTVPSLFYFFFFCAAFPEINPTSKLLEGKQREHCHRSTAAHGARESRGSVHCHAHRHGLYGHGVGAGKPGVTAQRER